MPRKESFPVNVGLKERAASAMVGAGSLGFLGFAARRDSRFARFLAAPVGLGAGYLLLRGLTGRCLMYKAMNIDRSGQAGIHVERAVTINRPRPEVYAFWRNFENLPRFMNHLESVEVKNGQSHWRAKAPLGHSVEWDARVTEEAQNEKIAWSSLPGSQVENRGIVEFRDAPGGRGTVVRVTLDYEPPAGSMGAAFAKLFGEAPQQQVREDLRHFKQIMETGEIPTTYGQTSGRVTEVEKQRDEIHHAKGFDVVQEASIESFPASDAPSWANRVQ